MSANLSPSSPLRARTRRPRISRPRLLVQSAADAEDDRRRLLAGLLERPARIEPKHFYDAQGSALYAAITRLAEYYPTRLEAHVLATHREEITAQLPQRGQWVDLGCGDGDKVLPWLQATQAQRYIAVDAAQEWLAATIEQFATRHREIESIGVVTDLSGGWSLQHLLHECPPCPPVFFYPGSSIGNFDPEPAIALLRKVREHCGEDGCLLIGVDLTRDAKRLCAAYDDAIGVTAAFNLNVLRVVNRMLDADFDPRRFAHVARFDERESRVEMHLMSRERHSVRFGTPADTRRNFELGETIITECSYKYSARGFADMLDAAGFTQHQLWTSGEAAPSFGVFLARA
ncbi:MAG TPA: L-histidine N(alpha)-methyltransferase [Nevskiaceae bacterium]|nr:L-histidine N(alpha)-methyltransferase [Nevskiaceae bacterium]